MRPHFLVPVLKDLMTQYPFVIHGFHSDYGSEYVNGVVVELLNKLSSPRVVHDIPMIKHSWKGRMGASFASRWDTGIFPSRRQQRSNHSTRRRSIPT
jgi:hypothetical protein